MFLILLLSFYSLLNIQLMLHLKLQPFSSFSGGFHKEKNEAELPLEIYDENSL
jgi:hypothetical protein